MVGAPNRDRRAERREATRQEILAAAWDVARQNGIAGLTLREVAVRVGMQPPSLYSHFDSKNAVYDAMYAQAWALLNARAADAATGLPDDPRERLITIAQTFFDFAMEDIPRSQLMNVRVLPDFSPSADAYRHAVEALDRLAGYLRAIGITQRADVDLYTALVSGLISQQQANDIEGDRWRRQLPRAMEMFADEVGLPPRTKKSGRTR
jgi:AcrR family transcriptional regulator